MEKWLQNNNRQVFLWQDKDIKAFNFPAHTLKRQSSNNSYAVSCIPCSEIQMMLMTMTSHLIPQTNHLHMPSLCKQKHALMWRHLISHNYGLGTSLYDYSRLFYRCYINNHCCTKPGLPQERCVSLQQPTITNISHCNRWPLWCFDDYTNCFGCIQLELNMLLFRHVRVFRHVSCCIMLLCPPLRNTQKSSNKERKHIQPGAF